MNSFAKLVNATGLFEFVACSKECRKISCKAGCFAGNIDNMIYSVRKNLWQCPWMNTVSWRIKNDHIWFFCKIIKNFKDISGNKFTVVKIIKSSILSGRLHCFFHDLYSDHFICYRCCKLSDSSGSAVEVKDYFIFGVSNILAHYRIEHFSCQ